MVMYFITGNGVYLTKVWYYLTLCGFKAFYALTFEDEKELVSLGER